MTTTRPPGLKAASLTAVLVGLGFLLGFGRDLLLARTYGADSGTDAFLVAWMVPETAAPLLIEGAMAFLMVPLFSRAAELGDDVRHLVSATLPHMGVALTALSVVTAAGAPWLVALLAPGIADAELAVRCMRFTAVTILMFGLAGYASAALRANHVFGPPATVTVAYNLGIVTCVLCFHDLGVVAAAVGVAIGGVGMVLVQIPSFVRRLGRPGRPTSTMLLPLGAFVPIAAFTLERQGQVFVERFVGSSLAEGSISHLNYAQKIAQVPMMLSLVAATVSFPHLVRAIAAGDGAAASRRLTDDLRAAATIVLLATGVLVVCAPDIVRLLLQYGAFTDADTTATAQIMRIYSLGLLGQAVVGVVCRVFFCGSRPSWYPAMAMVAGLGATVALALPSSGPSGIAAANAAGITLTAVILLAGLRGSDIGMPVREIGGPAARLLLAAVVATAAGWGARSLLEGLPSAAALVLAALAMAAAFCAVTALTGTGDFNRMIRMRGRS
ncbi:murein biosynthesis integral membrane protein MurJ [Nonomuraea sp. bgisy101]|uniref:murein biosynthesis integral membrane protein MurJ n=1 Tax=Nonomuraea sp. bgisy101 TaxID=3413784 RepID=UPI003D73A02F